MFKWLIGSKPKRQKKANKPQNKIKPAAKVQQPTDIHSVNPDHDHLLAQIRAIAADHPEQTTALLAKWLKG